MLEECSALGQAELTRIITNHSAPWHFSKLHLIFVFVIFDVREMECNIIVDDIPIFSTSSLRWYLSLSRFTFPQNIRGLFSLLNPDSDIHNIHSDNIIRHFDHYPTNKQSLQVATRVRNLRGAQKKSCSLLQLCSRHGIARSWSSRNSLSVCSHHRLPPLHTDYEKQTITAEMRNVTFNYSKF